MRVSGYLQETENTVKAVRYNDGAIRIVIPKDICEAYRIAEGDDLGFFIAEHPYKVEKGDLVLKTVRKALKEAG